MADATLAQLREGGVIPDQTTGPGAERFPTGRVVVALLLTLGVAVLASVMIGTESVSPTRLVRALTQGREADVEAWSLVFDYRLPRTLVAIAVGAALGVAGAVI